VSAEPTGPLGAGASVRDLRLVLPALVAWGVGWVAVRLPEFGVAAWAVPVWCWATAAGAAIAVLRWRRPAATVALVAAAAAGVVATSAGVALSERERGPLAGGRTAAAEVVVELVGAPRDASYAAVEFASEAGGEATSSSAPQRVRADARLVGVDGRSVRALPVVAEFEVDPARIGLGSRVVFDARAQPQPSAERAALRLRGAEAEQVTAPPWWAAWALPLRSGLVEAATALGGDGGALVPGLAVGDERAVGEELDVAMKASSLSHLTAVSGANCAIITAAAFWIAARCRAPRWARVAIAIGALLAFVVLVTPQASVVRAATMAMVLLIALARGRRGGGVPALATAVIALLVVDPWYAGDFGFALSVAATGGLLLLAPPLAERLARVMPGPLAVVLAVPTAAQLACQPILVLLEPAIPLTGVAANLLAAPAAPAGTVLGLLACLVLPVLPSLGFAFAQLAWLPASWIAALAHAASSAPVAQLPWPPGPLGAALLLGTTALALRLVLGRRQRRPMAALSLALVALVMVGTVGGAIGTRVLPGLLRPSDWFAVACDVGQGDAVLLRSGGSTMLVDTGPDPALLDRCLGLAGVERIDLLVLTHWDADHVGGAAAVSDRVAAVLHGPPDEARSRRALAPFLDRGIPTAQAEAGRHGELGGLSWRVLWPDSEARPGNDASVVLGVDGPRASALLLGDLGETAQIGLAQRLASDRPGGFDLVKVAHHGSADQHEGLYAQTDAVLGLVGVGADNGYGHPTASLLELLQRHGVRPARTDVMGTVFVGADGEALRLWSERGAGRVPRGPPVRPRGHLAARGTGCGAGAHRSATR